MIEIDKVSINGFKDAIRGMRNPMNSWDRSDSEYCADVSCSHCIHDDTCSLYLRDGLNISIGPKDYILMKNLRNSGSDDRKFMRMIVVYMDITAPLYWWKEFDTYKVGTVANSCSTMHKIHSKEFVLDDFSTDHLLENPNFTSIDIYGDEHLYSPKYFIEMLCQMLNYYRNLYNETKDKQYWYQMIQLLPSSYNQKRTVMLNYEVLLNMYHARKNHKLDEWRDFCKFIETLPYRDLIIGDGENDGIS